MSSGIQNEGDGGTTPPPFVQLHGTCVTAPAATTETGTVSETGLETVVIVIGLVTVINTGWEVMKYSFVDVLATALVRGVLTAALVGEVFTMTDVDIGDWQPLKNTKARDNNTKVRNDCARPE
jgi:hypothetical protein